MLKLFSLNDVWILLDWYLCINVERSNSSLEFLQNIIFKLASMNERFQVGVLEFFILVSHNASLVLVLFHKRGKSILFINIFDNLLLFHLSKEHVLNLTFVFWENTHGKGWRNQDVWSLHDVRNVNLLRHRSEGNVGDSHVGLLSSKENIFIRWGWIMDFTWVIFYFIKYFLLIGFKLCSDWRMVNEIRILSWLKLHWQH